MSETTAADNASTGMTGQDFQNLYRNYYTGSEASGLAAKRRIAAEATLSHIAAVVGSDRFARLVDVGAGEGSLLEQLDKAPLADQCYALEISESGLEAIQSRSLSKLQEAQLFDGYRIPYADKFFDLAVSIHVIEHVEHERLLLKELRRVAKRIVIEAPLENGLRAARAIALSGPYGHINFYLPDQFLNLLKTTGLKPRSYRIFNTSLAYDQHIGGKWKGLIKNRIREAFLRAAPRLAPACFSYMITVYCDTE